MLQKIFTNGNFTETNDNYMHTSNETYRLFAELLDEVEIFRIPEISFSDICRLLKVRPSALDSLLIKELGMSGEELLENRRRGCKELVMSGEELLENRRRGSSD